MKLSCAQTQLNWTGKDLGEQPVFFQPALLLHITRERPHHLSSYPLLVCCITNSHHFSIWRHQYPVIIGNIFTICNSELLFLILFLLDIVPLNFPIGNIFCLIMPVYTIVLYWYPAVYTDIKTQNLKRRINMYSSVQSSLNIVYFVEHILKSLNNKDALAEICYKR